MSFTRYAYAEAHVLEVKGARTKQHTASLDTVSGFDNYRTDDGFMYVRIRAISSRVNKNHDGWPTVELAGSRDILNEHKHSSDGFTIEAKNGNKKRGFASFTGKPIFVDHNNTDPEKGRGVIVDSKFRVLDQKTASEDKYWKSADVDKEHLPASEVELLLEVDSKSYPKFAKAIRDGDLDGFSMGANVEYTKCSHCGNVAHDPGDFCSHVLMKGATHDVKTADGKRVSKKSYENCYGVGFFEISGVFDPADETALAREVRASVPGSVHQAELYDGTPSGIVPFNGPDLLRGGQDDWVQTHADHLQKNFGYDPSTALQMAQDKFGQPATAYGEGGSNDDYVNQPLGPPPYDDPLLNDDVPVGWENHGVHNDPRWSSAQFKDPMRHVAENPLPQDMQTKAPDEVDTLRTEQVCPVCGNDMDGEQCDVCGYVAPPKEFDNPDLTKAQEVRDEMKEQDNQQSDPQSPAPDPGAAAATPPPGPPGPPPNPAASKAPATAGVNSDTMRNWTPKLNAKVAARINQVERPVRQTGQTTNEPKDEVVLSDQVRPVTSAMRTAQQLIAANNNSGETMQTRTADGPTPPGDTSADARVDVTGVGGFMDASNEQASKANAQVDVTGVGGTGVEGVEADSTETLPTAGESSDDSGFNADKTTEDSGPTKTYEDSDGSHSGVGDPVTSETPYWVDESKWSRVNLAADGDDKTLEQQEQQGDPVAQGGSAVKGVQPIAEQFGERVNVLEHKTSPANNSGPTTTWTGTDGNGVLKQQEPVTQESMEWGGVKTPDVKLHTTGAHHINVDRLVDLEESLSLLAHEDRWNRMAALHHVDPREVAVQIETLSKVKTAGTKLAAQHKLATRIPKAIGAKTTASHDFQRIASEEAPAQPVYDTDMDSALFSR